MPTLDRREKRGQSQFTGGSGTLPLVPRRARKAAGGYAYHVLNRGVRETGSTL